MGEATNSYTMCGEDFKGRDCVGGLGVDWEQDKWCLKVYTRSFGLRIGSCELL
jgi:hypothetical protein